MAALYIELQGGKKAALISVYRSQLYQINCLTQFMRRKYKIIFVPHNGLSFT
jgi:hypothetical protein